jgi:hypothetical protein
MYSRVWHWLLQGRIHDFKLGGGAHLKKSRRAEGGAKNFGVFRVKNHDFTTKKSYFFQLRREARKYLGYFVWKITILRQKIIFFPILGGRAPGAPPPLDPPLLLDLPPLYPCSSAPIWRSPSQFYSSCYTFWFIGTSFYSYICV